MLVALNVIDVEKSVHMIQLDARKMAPKLEKPLRKNHEDCSSKLGDIFENDSICIMGFNLTHSTYPFDSADDWICGRCSNVNWQRRKNCNVCSAPKISEVEERTGELNKVGGVTI